VPNKETEEGYEIIMSDRFDAIRTRMRQNASGRPSTKPKPPELTELQTPKVEVIPVPNVSKPAKNKIRRCLDGTQFVAEYDAAQQIWTATLNVNDWACTLDASDVHYVLRNLTERYRRRNKPTMAAQSQIPKQPAVVEKPELFRLPDRMRFDAEYNTRKWRVSITVDEWMETVEIRDIHQAIRTLGQRYIATHADDVKYCTLSAS
jgi:hypothetical protein